ncbi:MAG: PIN domain-containing protein [Opitutales bacterium]|nr:PIN domain-containing protein [Opitutales bacterium]
MKADFNVVLDSCVLANFAVCDLLLRLAERPRLFLPVWSDTILQEVHRTQVEKLNWEKRLADSFRKELSRAFPGANVQGYEKIIPSLTNEEKDRHVLAAAIHSGSSLILTFNLRDFSTQALSPWCVKASHPEDYLLILYEMEPVQVANRVAAIAARRGLDQEDVLLQLGKVLPRFSSKLIMDLDMA